jgi:glycosyltransferase involved in cell wall biosynthesis
MLVDVTNTLHQPYTTGIQRVVREFAAAAHARGALLVEFSLTTGGWHEVDLSQLHVTTNAGLRRAVAFAGRRAYRGLVRRPSFARAADSVMRSRQSTYESARRLVGGRSLGIGPRVDVRGRTLVLPEITSSRAHAQALEDLTLAADTRLRAFLHDVLPWSHPEWFPPDPRHHFEDYLRVLRHAERIAVASRHSEAEAKRALSSCPAEFGRFPLPAAIRATRGRPTEPLFLMVGSLEPRKNHRRVIEAALALRAAGLPSTLVFVGQTGWGDRGLREAVVRARRAGLRLVERRTATDDELHAWYQRATALVYPSLEEGYGLPVVEALASGTPVITSDRPALDEFEVFGGVVLVDPCDTEAIAAAMRRLADPVAWGETVATIDAARLPVGWDRWSADVFTWLAR